MFTDTTAILPGSFSCVSESDAGAVCGSVASGSSSEASPSLFTRVQSAAFGEVMVGVMRLISWLQLEVSLICIFFANLFFNFHKGYAKQKVGDLNGKIVFSARNRWKRKNPKFVSGGS